MSDSASRTDRDLFGAASSGDAQALAELARRHARGLYDFALRGTLDEQQADAVLGTVFRRVSEPGTVVPSQIEFRTWLYSLGLVEVLAVSNETRTARISTDDQRFYQRTTEYDPEIAHWAWQAARGLRTRDYCVLDLTLRRGLTPEEVAEAASLTRSNLYASIGRARGAFEETFAAMLLYEHGREACAELNEMVEAAPGTSLRPALRHQIIEHSDDCDACRRTLEALPLAANVYVSLADIEMPEALARRLLGLEPMPEIQPAAPTVQEESATATAAALAAGTAALEAGDAPRQDATWDDVEEVDEVEDEAGDFEFDDDAGEEELEDEDGGMEPAPLVAGVAALETRSSEPEAAPVTPVSREPPVYVYEETFGDRVAGWVERARGQPLMWTYAALGILAVIAIYLGVAVADSLRSGGGDSGAVPLNAPPGATTGRMIDCAVPIQVAAGESTLVSFDAEALDRYEISEVSVSAVSGDAEEGGLLASREDAFSILFTAAEMEGPRRPEYEVLIQWQREGEPARSACEVLVTAP